MWKAVYVILTFFLVSELNSSSAQTVFNFPQDEHDFGVAEEGENLSFVFEFTNSGKDTLHLKEESRDVRPGCSCTASEYTRTPVPPGQTGFVKAGYNTQGRIGAFQKNITVSQKGKAYKILTIKGIVVKKIDSLPAPENPKKVPELVINKKDHYFGKIEKDQNVSWRFNISNPGKDTLKIMSSYSACKCISYKLLDPKDHSSVMDYILPKKSALLEVHYTPGSTAALSDTKTLDILTLLTNVPDKRKLSILLSAEFEESLK